MPSSRSGTTSLSNLLSVLFIFLAGPGEMLNDGGDGVTDNRITNIVYN